MDPTLQGSLAELCFTLRAIEHGLIVSRPISPAPYDFITDSGGFFRRVQVKSVSVPDRRQAGYRVSSGFGGSSRRPYSARQIDLLAAFIIPAAAWYIIPISAFAPCKTIRLHPRDPTRDRFGRYREAWDLLQATTNNAVILRKGGSRAHSPARETRTKDLGSDFSLVIPSGAQRSRGTLVLLFAPVIRTLSGPKGRGLLLQ